MFSLCILYLCFHCYYVIQAYILFLQLFANFEMSQSLPFFNEHVPKVRQGVL